MSHPQAILTDLSHEGLIRTRGADAVSFLQGQLSTDVEALGAATSQLSSWNNAKGRVVSLLRLFQRGDDIYLALPGGLKATVLKRLSMYVLRSKVQLTDSGSELSRLGLIGEGAPALLAQADIPVPASSNETTSAGAIQAIRLGGETPRYAIYGPADALASLKDRWASTTSPGTEDDWALHRILAGEPTVCAETSEHFVAQMLDLDKLGGIDFKKGCYIGQEVIARTHYRGGVKRHLARAACESASMLRPGIEIHHAEQDTSIAEIVDARRDNANVWQMLMVIQDDFRGAPLAIGSAPVRLI